MKPIVYLVAAFLFGALITYQLMSRGPWTLVRAGTALGSEGVAVIGIFERRDQCLRLRQEYLDSAKSAFGADVQVEARGIVRWDAAWRTLSCLRMKLVSGLPGKSLDLSRIEDALGDIATNVIR